jgi:hypothetical protein
MERLEASMSDQRLSEARSNRIVRVPRVLALLVTTLLVACGDTASLDESLGVVEQAAISVPPASLTIALPDNMVPQAVPILATRTLVLKDRVAVRTKGGGYGTVVSTGTNRTDLGVEAKTGAVFSKPAVAINHRVRVEGFVKSAGSVTLGQGAVVTGGVQASTPLGPLRSSTFQTAVPPRTFGSHDVQPDKTLVLAPGGYANLSVKGRATVHLRAGS